MSDLINPRSYGAENSRCDILTTCVLADCLLPTGH
jgi:hypothetical protein